MGDDSPPFDKYKVFAGFEAFPGGDASKFYSILSYGRYGWPYKVEQKTGATGEGSGYGRSQTGVGEK